jgi:pimeloyl-ACP methyl ester carboxylesterase
MSLRSRFLLLACTVGCVADEPVDDNVDVIAVEQAASLAFTRAHVTDDIYHYEVVLPVGSSANAAIRIHRVVRELAPWIPRPTSHAAMMLHGDFATFPSNFPRMAPYLAARNIDVWGVDRRWTLAPVGPDADVSDFATMGLAQEVDDLRAALALARAVRLAGGSGGGKLALVGFSHGAQLAYTYVAVEGARPAAQRHVDALVPLDFYADYEDEESRLFACELSAGEYAAVADGVVDSPNGLFIEVGRLARTAPDELSPFDFFGPVTNRQMLLITSGQTYKFAPFAPFYHFTAPILDGDTAIGLSETSEAAVQAWFEAAAPHQSMLESADFDALLCGEGPQPVDAQLSRIRTPVFYIGAAGGIGTLGLHSTTSVSSTDVTTLVVQRFGPERRAEDFGHADLLFATDARTLAWQPLAGWLLHH